MSMPEFFLGEIQMSACQWVPYQDEDVTCPCNGQTLSISDYQPLYSILGTLYGGDGRSTFGLPNLTGGLPIGSGTRKADGTVFTVGQNFTKNQLSLTSANLPSHTHDAGTVTFPSSAVQFTSTANPQTVPLTATSTVTQATAVSTAVSTANSVLNCGDGANAAISNDPASRFPGQASPPVGVSLYSFSRNATMGAGFVTTGVNTTVNTTLNVSVPTTVQSSVSIVSSSTVPAGQLLELGGSTGLAGSFNVANLNMAPALAVQFYIIVKGLYPFSGN